MAEKSRFQIEMDLAKARNQARKLEEAARSVRRESERFESCRSDVRQAWEGDNATRFTNKMNKVSNDLTKVANQLDRTADAIRKSAKKIHDAEMEAKRLADIRRK